MRILTWNHCRGKHDVKLPLVLPLHPDVAVLVESPRPKCQLGSGQLWHGRNNNQGLLVLTFGEWSIEQAEPLQDEAKYFLPARVKGPGAEFNLIAIWVNPKPGGSPPVPAYRQTLLRGLQIHKNLIDSGPTVVIGDLNVPCAEVCETFRLISAYHQHFKSQIGDETHFTHYFRRDRWNRFHYDYCLLPEEWSNSLTHVEVGAYDQWVKHSDHCPLIVDISMPISRRTSRSSRQQPRLA